jgi:hypothetical protein
MRLEHWLARLQVVSCCFPRFCSRKTGDALLRPPVTHTDEALDDLEVVLIEIKK